MSTLRPHIRSASQSGQHAPQPSSPSPPSSPKHASLSVGGVTNIFLRMRHHRDRSRWPNHIASSSGELLQTHPSTSAHGYGMKSGPFEMVETYICRDAVNMVTLLSHTRNALLSHSSGLGANALIDEQWSYTISGPKYRSDSAGTYPMYRVQISYTASTIRSSMPDPRKPVALDNIKNVTGCMTIHQRH